MVLKLKLSYHLFGLQVQSDKCKFGSKAKLENKFNGYSNGDTVVKLIRYVVIQYTYFFDRYHNRYQMVSVYYCQKFLSALAHKVYVPMLVIISRQLHAMAKYL